jgi:methylmalonyl-CoA mutase cobalamin-binding domain/chain
MTHEETKPLYLKKSVCLGNNAPLRCETVTCRESYEADLCASRLYAHEIVEISMIVSGNGVHRVLNQPIPCKTGDLYITSPNIPHGYFNADSENPLVIKKIIFDPKDWFSPEISTVGEPRYCYGIFNDNAILAYAMLNAETYTETELLFASILSETAGQKTEWKDAVGAYLTQLLIKISRYIGSTIKNIPSAPSKEWNTVLSTLRIIMNSYDDPHLTLETIASSLYISKSHLSRLFHKLIGESFSDYLRRIRMDQACQLLRETKLNMEEIVTRCGLRDMQSFYHNFQALMHVTPHQYRLSQNPISAVKPPKTDEHAENLLHEISENLQHGKATKVKELILKALDRGMEAQTILTDGLLLGMSIIGERFKNNEVFVPEVLVASRTMNHCAQALAPYLSDSPSSIVGRVCLGTVEGDLHDIGKNLVRLMMESKGLEVIDLGVDVSPKVFVQTAIEKNCDVIACSALLTTTRGVMEDVVRECEKAGIRHRVKILVGGSPITEEFCQRIGADIYAPDACTAAEAALAYCKNNIAKEIPS